MNNKRFSQIRRVAYILAIASLSFATIFVFYIGKKASNFSNNKLLNEYHDYCNLGFQLKKEKKIDDRILSSYDIDISDILDSILFDIPKIITPFVGSAPSPGKYFNTSISKQQFRGGKKISTKKVDEYRIFVVGGSVAFGAGSPHDTLTIPHLLEKELNKNKSLRKRVKVYNASCPAWTTTQEHIWISNHIINFNPDLVIEFSGRNDAYFNIEHKSDIGFYRSMWDHLFNLLIKNIYSNSNFNTYKDDIIPKNNSSKISIRNLDKNVRLNILLSEMYNFDYCFILQPSLAVENKTKTTFENKIYEQKKETKYSEKLYKYYNSYDSVLLSLETNNRLNYYDFRDCFKDEKWQIYIDECHFGDRGNKIVAKKMAKSISQIITK